MNLNHLVEIERRGPAQDSAGQPRDSWQKVGQAFASIRPISARAYFAASGERAKVTHEIIIRFGVTVTPRDRIRLGDRVFDVETVFNVDEQNRFLRIYGGEDANNGL